MLVYRAIFCQKQQSRRRATSEDDTKLENMPNMRPAPPFPITSENQIPIHMLGFTHLTGRKTESVKIGIFCMTKLAFLRHTVPVQGTQWV